MQAFSKLSQALLKRRPFVVPSTPFFQRISYFKPTNHRWLYNEDLQNACRYVEFDVEALQKVACDAVGAKGCTGFTILGEGAYNRVFNLTFDNGKEAIARIPTKLVGPPILVTASEVATMEFAREVLLIPTPRVLAWNARKEVGAVGSEYIIMEKAQGVKVRGRWFEIAGPTAAPFFHELFAMEKSSECAPFLSIGSLYFKEDVSAELQAGPLFDMERLPKDDPDMWKRLVSANDKYRIGPITDRQWWRNERLGMPENRGPWKDLPSFLQGTIQLQRSWISEFAVSNSTKFHRRGVIADVAEHMRLLDLLSEVIPFILPPAELSAPTLWHPDLSLSNIFVNDSGPANITSYIDWQHSIVAPYFMQSIFPTMLKYKGSLIEYPPSVSVMPKLPDNFATLSPDMQHACNIELKLAFRQKLYEGLINRSKGNRLQATKGGLYILLSMLPHSIVRSWTDGPGSLQTLLMQFQTFHPEGEGAPPEAYTRDEVLQQQEDYKRHVRYMGAIDALYSELDCSGDGRIELELYDASREKLEIIRAEWDDDANGGPFPFVDGMYSFYLT